jgi:hypothetical protein
MLRGLSRTKCSTRRGDENQRAPEIFDIIPQQSVITNTRFRDSGSAPGVHVPGVRKENRMRKKRIVRRAVLIALVAAALVEPILMYRSLQKQKEQRHPPTEQAVQAPGSRPGAGG